MYAFAFIWMSARPCNLKIAAYTCSHEAMPGLRDVVLRYMCHAWISRYRARALDSAPE